MRRADQSPRTLRTIASVSLFAATVLALANLPASELPIPWLLAFTIPGAILGSWSRLARSPWRRALIAVFLQASACYLALDSVGPMTRPAALACTILPPLAFATTRNHDADPSLALFLSFCVMLVGVILDGIDMALLLTYGAVAFLSLHTATLLQAHRSSNPQPKPTPVRTADLMATSMMMLSCMVAVFAVERTLSCLPSPSRNQNAGDGGASKNSSDREVGLDDSFILDGGDGMLSELNGEQLVRAKHADDSSVRAGMYLRCGFFTVPGMDRWEIGKLELEDQSHENGHEFRRASRTRQVRQLSIERFGGAAKFVFLPPNPVKVRGLDNLTVDPLRGWIRPKQPNTDLYIASYQNLPEVRRSARVDLQAGRMNLLQLPADIDIGQFEQLLEEWEVPRNPQRAFEAMRTIADGLAITCRYSRSEPIGEYSHKIENFLFSSKDRRGYCMHFASAAALMLRMRGIPCRIAVGLYGGKPETNGSGARMFGSQHAHAWVEVPFEGRGFVTYDPTPPESRGVPVAPSNAPAAGSDPTVEIERSVLDPAMRAISTAVATPWTWAIVLALVLVLAMLPRREPQPPMRQQAVVAPQARRALAKLLRALAHAGHRRFPGQTLELFAQDLEERERLAPEVRTAFDAYQEVRFGGRIFDQERLSLMQKGVRAAIAMRAADESRRQANS